MSLNYLKLKKKCCTFFTQGGAAWRTVLMQNLNFICSNIQKPLLIFGSLDLQILKSLRGAWCLHSLNANINSKNAIYSKQSSKYTPKNLGSPQLISYFKIWSLKNINQSDPLFKQQKLFLLFINRFVKRL